MKLIEEPLRAIRKEVRKVLGSIHQLTATFTPEELKQLICGEKCVDLDDWYLCTTYKGDLNLHSLCVENFWKLICILDKTQLSSLLYFALGFFKLPVGGFKNLAVTDNKKAMFIIRGLKDKKNLMTASTCFNLLDIPYEDNYSKFVKVVTSSMENSRGFGGVD